MASVRVAVRVRPMNRREKDLTAKCIIKMEGTKTSITNLKIPDGVLGDSMREHTKTFTYDFSYDSMDCKSAAFVSQEKVFKDLGSDVLKAAFEGYNACVFAYGQTGSGKSYTMMGAPGDAGLIPRICEGLFSRVSEATRWDEASFRTEVSYLEIYNERVRDLLRRKSTQTYNLRVREHPKDGPYVEDLSKHLVQNYSDVEELMEAGNINRTTASTGMNDVSSRSHAIFTINFTQAKFDAEMPSETISKIHLVDLAGSERADATGATGVRLKEGGNINKSLVTLGNVISALADMAQGGANTNLKRKSVFVPYRDSVLTWLLKDSLGGNSKTIMIATISPADVNYGETLSTLRYANRAKNIINKPTINEDANVRLIRELRAEIARLKALLVQGNQIALLDSPTALSMEEKLHQNEARVLELTKEWTNKWNETQNILKEETLALRKEGIGVVLDSELPHLIGIDDDLLSTGIILYHLKEGRTYVGREDASTEQDIILHGLDLESEHCMFENRNGTVTLVPLGGAQCSVNGVQVTEPSQLNQGAVILLGRTNMFRFNHPKEAAKLREKRKSGLLTTFSLSMTDLSKSCENLSTVMLYNPGLEFERQQREELEKLEMKRRLIKEMEAKQQSEKAELERLQQEVESQRKESEEVQQRILRQEESLHRRSQDIESRLRDFLAEKERFEEERRSEIRGFDLQRRQRRKELQECEADGAEEQDEQQRKQQAEIYRELERLKREREEQQVRLETERRRLEEQEREQLSLVGRLEEQLREKHEAATTLLTREDSRRLEEERRALAEIREMLLRAKETAERPDVEDASEEARAAQSRYVDFKTAQVKELDLLEEGLLQQRERLEKEVAAERNTLLLLTHSLKERQQQLKETPEKGAQDATWSHEEQLVTQAEHRLQFKERQLASLADSLLPAVAEEKQRAVEVLERSSGGSNGNCDNPPGLDNTLFQVEKELEDKEEKLNLHWHSAQQLQQLQETYEFTANVARQEEKVRRKEKEILESKEKQQREAMEQAVARLEKRHSALRRSISLEPDSEEQRHKSFIIRTSRTGAEMDQQRVEQEIQKLRQRISEGEEVSRTHSISNDERTVHSGSPVSHIQSLNTLLPLSDDRINAYIEEEVQRRLQKMNLLNGSSGVDLSLSCESLREEEDVSDCSSVRLTDEDEEKLQNMNPRKLKYQRASGSSFQPSLEFEAVCPPNVHKNVSEEPESGLVQIQREEMLESTDEVLIEKVGVPKESDLNKGKVITPQGEVGQAVCYRDCFNTDRDFRQDEPQDQQTNKSDENEHFKKDEGDSTCCVGDDDKKQELLVNGRSSSYSEEKAEHQTCDPVTAEEAKLSSNHSSKLHSFNSGYFGSVIQWLTVSQQQMMESFKGQTKQEMDPEAEKMTASKSYVFGCFAEKLSEVYKDAGRRLQGTRDIIRNVQAGEMKVVLSQYVTMISKELPLIPRMQPQQQPEPPITAEHKGSSVDLSKDCALRLPQNYCTSAIPNISGWPEGSVSSSRNTSPEVFHQRLVMLPTVLSELQTFSSQKILEKLESLAPQENCGKVLSLFWLRVANRKKPVPRPACLLLSEKNLMVLSASTDSTDTVTIFHRFKLREIKEVQISLAGQHIRLISSTEDTVLAVFTYSKELTQDFCKALVKALSLEMFPEGTEGHPLLSDDLMVISLDWTSIVPDINPHSGPHITSRFKRVLADLLYIIHGNMDGPGKPSLANICPLLYTSVKVRNSTRGHQDTILQFLLTDTHVALFQEDGVFHPVPRGSSLVPARPQFQGLELRKRSDIRCLLVKKTDTCVVVDFVFKKPQTLKREMQFRRDSAGVPSKEESWRLCFGCSSEAQHLVSRPPGMSCDGVQEPVKISIPRYVLRGQGKDEHFEFEVKITVMDDTWTVFRRYSRFREMHRNLKLKYSELTALDFPPKKLFRNRDERMVAERRTHLERYLKDLFRVMLSSSSSPLRADEDGLFHLSKRDVCEFLPFFKKGVFEYSSHGTG
ncbi:kinesin-like protein KIF16B isoform X2 [Archocentrus centrarchus]|uniref:kinesin-like protein KIF16B isoform X2 n=1 Tax=Archocentrus centrarchus TaxID=63155 RepID=UPI0011EA460F|nr:kinesin-like protein KIF16B isoform X2 [Archocentrus centrarchus]